MTCNNHGKLIKMVDTVSCYMDGGFAVEHYSTYNYHGDQSEEIATVVIQCGSYDGEYINLFELQEWFDDNREWINSLKTEEL
tara:strand:+ start:589 stop:834 length:246 start_codon:yes stop_codon:yes gene_type:complete